MIDNVLSVKNLTISFREKTKNKRVLHNSSFNLKRGTTLSLVGESGSGKSITSLAVVSLLPMNAITTGSIMFNQKELIGLNESELISLTHNAIKYSFCDEENKNKLLSKLN